jgi:hypothetical protein
MRAPFTWLVVAVGILLVIVAAAAIGNRDESGDTVPAGEWAQNVCATVGVWRGQMEAIVEDVTMPPATSTGSEEPQSETPEGRTGLIRVGLERSVQATETVVEAIDGSGVPDTANGEEAAEQVSSWADGAVDDLNQAEDLLDDEAETLEESVEQLTAAAGAIGAVLESGRQTIADIAVTDPELADALRDSGTCQHVREETGEQ